MSRILRLMAFIVLAVAVQGWLATGSLAQSPEALLFRRVFVPEDGLESEIRGLLPLKREEFERRLGLAARQADSSAVQAEVRVERATFRGRVEGNRLVDGTAELEVVSAVTTPALLPITPCNVAVKAAMWQGDRRPAVIGAGPDGVVRCLVEKSGTLRLEWVHAASPRAPDETTFELQLPAAARRELEIVAHGDSELSIDGGLLVAKQPGGGNSGEQVWRFALSGRPLTRLRARSLSHRTESQAPFVVRESSTYAFFGSSLDVETSLNLDGMARPRKTLELKVDRGLEITAVRLQDSSLPLRASAESSDGPIAVSVQLPEEFSEATATLQISATADWPTKDRRSLPRMRLSDGLFQEGRMVVSAGAWLRLRARPVAGCVQTNAMPAAAGRSSDRFEFQLFEPGAEVEVSSAEIETPLVEESGTQITVDSGQVRGVLIAELTSASATHFEVAAQVPRPWVVDSVEAQPPEMLADRLFTMPGGGPRQVRLKLGQPLTPQRPLRLVIRAHYRRPANNRPLGEAFFGVASFPEAQAGRKLVAVRVNDPGAELQSADGGELPRLDPAKLTAGELRLFESPPGTLLLERGPRQDTWSAMLRAATARFRADVLVRADVGRGGSLQNAVKVRCEPEISAVGSIAVRLSPRPRGDVVWRMGGQDSRELQAVVESPGGSTGDDVVHRVLLRAPQTAAFELIGQWHEPTASSEVSLATVPEATRQTGLVEIHSADGGVLVDAKGVQPLPRRALSDDGLATLRARYRYEAGRQGKIAVEPASGRALAQGAWIETLRLTSHFSLDGSGQHEAAFTVRNSGLSSFQVQLPDNARDWRLVLDDGAEQPLDSSGSDDAVVVPLPALGRVAIVHVRYSSSGSPLGFWPMGTLAAPVPQPDLAVIAQTWSAQLPPGLAATAQRDVSISALLAKTPRSAPFSLHSLGEALRGPALAARLGLWPMADASAEAEFPGWTVREIDLPRGPQATLVAYRTAVVSGWSLCLALVAAAVVLMLQKQLKLFPALAVLFAAFATASQAPLNMLLGGASLGLMIGSLLLLLRPKVMPRGMRLADQALRTSPLRAAGPATTAIVMLALGLASCVLAAQPDDQTNKGVARPRVVFPIDGSQQPAGDYAYLDGQLYESLLRVTDRGPGSLPDWLLESAHYELPAAGVMDARGAAVNELKAVLDFHTFHAGAEVRFPFRREQILLLERRARLDGQPITLNWQPDGEALTLTVDSAGKHRLELWVGAVARASAAGVELELKIPPAAVCTFSGPASSELVSPAASAVHADGRQHFQIPSCEHVKLRWPLSGTVPASTTPQAEQLLWWKIRPGSVVLEGQFQVRPGGVPITEVVIEADPRLRLLPGGANSPATRVQVEEGAANRVRVQFDEPKTLGAPFRLSWLWPDASGGGQYLFPHVRLRTGELVRNWTAISAGAGLEPDDASEVGSLFAAEFIAAWGEAGPAGENFLVATAAQQVRPFVVRPVHSLPGSAQSIDWSISRTVAQATYTARLTGLSHLRFDHTISVPAALKVNGVTLTQAGRRAAIRWAQADDKLVVWLMEAPAAEQVLTFTADLELPKEQAQLHLPSILLEETAQQGYLLRIYRRADVQIEVQSPADWRREDDSEPGQYREGFGRLAVALQSEGAMHSPPMVTRWLNQPRVTGQMFIRADEADGDWRGEAQLNLQIADGVLDDLRLAIPEAWAEALEFEPAMEQRMNANSLEPRRQLTLRPRQAVTGEFRLRIRGPILSGASGLVAPDVNVLGRAEIECLVLLDRGSRGQTIDWEVAGLQAASSSDAEKLPPEWRETGADLFRVLGPHFDATARTRQSAAATPQVRLADLRAALQSGRRVGISAAITILPRGAREATFSLPLGCRLVQTLIDDAVAPCRATGLRSWTIAASSEVLPYRLTIVYDTFVPADSAADSTLLLMAPRLAGMEVERYLWEIRNESGPMSALATKAASGARESEQPSGPPDAALIRLETSVRALEDVASALGADIPSGVLAEAFARWRAEVEVNHRNLMNGAGQDALADEVIEQAQVALDAAARVRQRLVQAGILDQDEPPLTRGQTADQSIGTPSHVVIVKEQSLELLVSVPPQPGFASARLAIALGIGLAAVLVFCAGHVGASRDWLLAHGPFVVAAIGVAWWLLAPWGWLGLILVMAAGWLALRPAWPSSSIRQSN